MKKCQQGGTKQANTGLPPCCIATVSEQMALVDRKHFQELQNEKSQRKVKDDHDQSVQAKDDEIRRLFGLSKKAYKRAVGHLLREGKISLGEDGTVRLVGGEGTSRSPAG